MKPSKLQTAIKVLIPLSVLSMLAALYLVFMVVPNERTMGPVQRILYFHVGSAMACYLCAAVVFFGSIWYLATHDQRADTINAAGGEVGLVFCSAVLFSGMIWGHSAWNTWFRWEPRLVTFLLLWFVYLGFNLLRTFGDPERIPAHSAVLGLVGSITVPLVVFSIYLLPGTEQLHPKDVVVGGLEHPYYRMAFWISVLAVILLQCLLFAVRLRMGFLESAYARQKLSGR